MIRTCRIVDFAALTDHCVKLKEYEKRDIYLDIARELRKLCRINVTVIPFLTRVRGTIPKSIGGCLRGVMVKAIDCGIVVREFVLQSFYYVHFRANTLGKGMNSLILPAMR